MAQKPPYTEQARPRNPHVGVGVGPQDATAEDIRTGKSNILNYIGKKAAEALYPNDWTHWTKPFAPYHSPFGRSNTSYSGCDITPTIYAGRTLHTLGNLHTLSYSLHRDKAQVRTLGRAYPVGITRGQLTVAGSLVFSVFDRHVLWDILREYEYEPSVDTNRATGAQKSRTPLSVTMPPFDISIAFLNEAGYMSYLKIYGVEIVDEGQTMSLDDMLTENIMQYIALDMDVMTPTDGSTTGPTKLMDKGIFTAKHRFTTFVTAQQQTVKYYEQAELYVQNLIVTEAQEEQQTAEHTENVGYLEQGLRCIQQGGLPNEYTKRRLEEKGLWAKLKKKAGEHRWLEALIGKDQAQANLDEMSEVQERDTAPSLQDPSMWWKHGGKW